MPYFSRIITTNWDRYFEDHTSSTPFVYETDMAFWEVAKRAVLKIHGSVDNYASIVATTQDYQSCEARLREGAMGAVLKQIMTSRTLIFVGFSATDEDFLHIYNTVQRGLAGFKRTHYLISPFVTAAEEERLRGLNIATVRTDGAHFLEVVKEHMCTRFCYTKDITFSRASAALAAIRREHYWFAASFDVQIEPHLICACFYQDGLIHALERIEDLRRSGVYSDLHHVEAAVRGYEAKIKHLVRERNYTEASYFIGYQNGFLLFLALNESEDETEEEEQGGEIPLYFHPGVGEIFSRKDFAELVRVHPSVHKGALAQCRRLAKQTGARGGTVLQHTPWG